MKEVLGWAMVVGCAVLAAAVPMVARHVKQETRRAFEAVVHDAMARLRAVDNGSAPAFEDTLAQNNDSRRWRPLAGAQERRAIARRRLEDVFPSLKTRRLGV